MNKWGRGNVSWWGGGVQNRLWGGVLITVLWYVFPSPELSTPFVFSDLSVLPSVSSSATRLNSSSRSSHMPSPRTQVCCKGSPRGQTEERNLPNGRQQGPSAAPAVVSWFLPWGVLGGEPYEKFEGLGEGVLYQPLTLVLLLAAQCEFPTPYRAIPFRDSIAEGGIAPNCLAFLGYGGSIAEIPIWGGVIAPPLRMLSMGETLRKGGGGIAPNWPC